MPAQFACSVPPSVPHFCAVLTLLTLPLCLLPLPLKVDNPSRQHTVLRTALKLKPFPFNSSPGNMEAHRQSRGYNETDGDGSDYCGGSDDSGEEDFRLCSICQTPVQTRECSRKATAAEGDDGKSMQFRSAWATTPIHGMSTGVFCHSCKVGMLGQKLW